jgi:hypothetical protein
MSKTGSHHKRPSKKQSEHTDATADDGRLECRVVQGVGDDDDG